MDAEHLAALRRWGEGLRTDDRDEVRAAGRAIVLLCDDVERLERELWHSRAMSTVEAESRVDVGAGGAEQEAESDGASTDADDAVTALKARFRRVSAAVRRR